MSGRAAAATQGKLKSSGMVTDLHGGRKEGLDVLVAPRPAQGAKRGKNSGVNIQPRRTRNNTTGQSPPEPHDHNDVGAENTKG